MNPDWHKIFVFDYKLGTPTKVAVSLFDEVAKGSNKPMGAAVFDIGELLGARGGTKAKKLKGKGTLYAQVRKSMGSGVFRLQMKGEKLKNTEGLVVKETKFNKHPVYLIEAPELTTGENLPVASVPVKDMYLSNLSEDTLLLGTKKSMKEVLSSVKFDKMLNITSSSQMMRILDDESALFFFAYSFENFLNTTAGQALALNPLAQGMDIESLVGLMFNADYKEETGLKLSLNLTFFSIDARKAFETKIKQLRNQQKAMIQHGTIDISGGSNKLTVTYELKNEELSKLIQSIRSQISGVPLDEDLDGDLDEEILDIPEEIE